MKWSGKSEAQFAWSQVELSFAELSEAQFGWLAVKWSEMSEVQKDLSEVGL